MSRKKNIRICPNCGSRNLQTEGQGKKGRKLYICAECDHEFEVRIGDIDSKNTRRSEKEN